MLQFFLAKFLQNDGNCISEALECLIFLRCSHFHPYLPRNVPVTVSLQNLNLRCLPCNVECMIFFPCKFSPCLCSYYWYWQHGQWGKTSDHDTICQRLWGVDYNRIQDRVNYEISLQARILKNSSVDKSYRRLFSNVNMKKIQEKPTFQAFIGKRYHVFRHFLFFYCGHNVGKLLLSKIN